MAIWGVLAALERLTRPPVRDGAEQLAEAEEEDEYLDPDDFPIIRRGMNIEDVAGQEPALSDDELVAVRGMLRERDKTQRVDKLVDKLSPLQDWERELIGDNPDYKSAAAVPRLAAVSPVGGAATPHVDPPAGHPDLAWDHRDWLLGFNSGLDAAADQVAQEPSRGDGRPLRTVDEIVREIRAQRQTIDPPAGHPDPSPEAVPAVGDEDPSADSDASFLSSPAEGCPDLDGLTSHDLWAAAYYVQCWSASAAAGKGTYYQQHLRELATRLRDASRARRK